MCINSCLGVWNVGNGYWRRIFNYMGVGRIYRGEKSGGEGVRFGDSFIFFLKV